jgi:hypothetical protein
MYNIQIDTLVFDDLRKAPLLRKEETYVGEWYLP